MTQTIRAFSERAGLGRMSHEVETIREAVALIRKHQGYFDAVSVSQHGGELDGDHRIYQFSFRTGLLHLTAHYVPFSQDGRRSWIKQLHGAR